MASDVDNIITIKQLLNNSINEKNFKYIKNILIKNVEDCNLLYTQVCYLIKLFLLKDYEVNINNPFNDYKFDELFIRKCFKLVKTGKLTCDDLNNKSLLNRLINFYNDYNLKNEFKFIKPDKISSITHITDSLSRDIQTNITNNIILNYTKYVKEYLNINLTIKFKNIDSKMIMKIYNDLINNTLYSDNEYHSWIKEHRNKIIPNFNNKIEIKTFKDGLDNHKIIFVKFINKYLNSNQKLMNLIHINNDNKKNIIKMISDNLINELIIESDNYSDWINENKNNIVNEFNLMNNIDLDKELNRNPFIFIPYMLYMNKNLELNNSKKKYQIIPLRTNLTPKFIPINVDSFVDILDSEYLLGNIKNYYHNDNKKGLILFETYFKFNSKYIKNIIKKGYVFSGLIYTNGFEINYVFNSKSYKINKKNFHLKGKEDIKFIKENTKNLNQEQKDEFIKKHNENKEKIKNDKLNTYKEKIKKNKQDEKNEHSKILKILDNEIKKIKMKYENEYEKLKMEHYKNLKLEFDNIDKTKKENKKLMDDIMNKYNDIFASKNIYLKYEADRNITSLINDYNNNIDEKYKEIDKKEKLNNNLIEEVKKEILNLKKELKKLKKQKFNFIEKEYTKNTKNMNLNINNNKKNKKILKRIIIKIKKKIELLKYNTEDIKTLTNYHFINIIKNISNQIEKIKELKISKLLNEYLNNFGNLNDYLLTKSNNEIIELLNNCFNYLSKDKLNNKQSIDMIKLMNYRLKKIKDKELIKTNEYKIKYNQIIEKLCLKSNELNKLLKEKKKIKNELEKLFKDKNNNNIKVDEMSKKMLSILNKLNWVVIDPGINSLLTMISKDEKQNLSYSKCEYLNKTKRKKIQNKIERIKKNKITELENKLTKEKTRLRTSNNYNTFNEYFIIKMSIHNEIIKLYEDPKLNKLKWYLFINEKRSQNQLVNKIKNKFGNDVVLIIGDWCMNKKGIKTISTPNKKYENLLSKNFITLKLNEFRTSIIENKTELKCENAVIKKDYKKMNIKEIYSLEELKKKNQNKYEKIKKGTKIHKILTCKTSSKFIKYVNRDKNAVKNMKKIVSEYILNNKKPMTFVMGTKICNGVFNTI